MKASLLNKLDNLSDRFEELTGARIYHMFIMPGGVRDGLPEGFDQAATEIFALGFEMAIAEDDRELVTAEAGRHVGGTECCGQTPRRLSDHLVASRVPVQVVVLLEVVHVDQHQGEWVAKSVQVLRFFVHEGFDGAAVEQSGQCVVLRQVLQSAYQAHDHHVAQHKAAGDRQSHAREDHPEAHDIRVHDRVPCVRRPSLGHQRDGHEQVVARVEHADADGPLIDTSWSGVLEPATAAALRRVMWRFPLLTFGVVARIHWHALLLWLKKVPFWRKPEPPRDFVTR